MPIFFNSLLKEAGIEPYNTRLLRHSPKKNVVTTPYTLWKKDRSLFEYYQSLQGGEPYLVGNNLASFLVDPIGNTLFVGIYKVNGVSVAPPGSMDLCINREFGGANLYDIERSDLMDDFVGLLTIEWGLGHRSWYQHADRRKKTVRELRLNYEEAPFPGYFLFRSKLSELDLLPSTWKSQLRSAKGVYVLTSLTSKQHYIGSAAGQGGFFQRWQEHAVIGGAAVGLQAHGASDYQVAILQVSAGFESDGDIVEIEHRWMDKLQTRGMGLNGQPREKDLKDPQGLP